MPSGMPSTSYAGTPVWPACAPPRCPARVRRGPSRPAAASCGQAGASSAVTVSNVVGARSQAPAWPPAAPKRARHAAVTAEMHHEATVSTRRRDRPQPRASGRSSGAVLLPAQASQAQAQPACDEARELQLAAEVALLETKYAASVQVRRLPQRATAALAAWRGRPCTTRALGPGPRRGPAAERCCVNAPGAGCPSARRRARR